MNRHFLFFLFIICFENVFGQFESFDKAYQEIIKSEQAGTFFKEQLFTSAPTGNYDLKYHRIHWHVSPDTLFISGEITSYFILTEDADHIYFDLTDTLIVDSVLFEGNPVSFDHINNAVNISFPVLKSAGTLDSVTVFYHGVPAYNNFGSMAISEHETGNNLWTLSEPYGASDWWPCKQTLNDKIDSLDIYITMPEGYKSGTAGLLISEITADGFTTDHWKTNYLTATYLIGISVANFEVYQFYAPHESDSVLFYNLIFPEAVADAVPGIDDIVESFQLYSDIYGEYPFKNEKYGHMQFGWGGGMEHQTMSSVVHFTFDLLVHEMAHQWFGDKVTCATWEDIWLNEGFATYSNALSYYFIDDIHIYWNQWLKGTRDVVTSEPDGSVWVNDTTDVYRIFSGRLTYYKGAWLLHMLHYVLGEDNYFTALQNYISDPLLAYNFATTNDLKTYFETTADTTLTEFFNDWFYGEGYPSYHLIWTQDENKTVSIALSQTPSHPSVDFFEMPVPVRLKGDNDSIDIILNHIEQGQLFFEQPDFTVNEIILDPDMWLLHANDTIAKAELNTDELPIIIFPNPATNQITIQDFSVQPQHYTIYISNVDGQNIIRRNFNGFISSQATIDVSKLSPGIYFVEIANEDKNLVQKIVVQ
jgi:aminopeptidase N